MSSGVSAKLLPIIKGHKVFLLPGGSPCRHKDYSKVFLTIIPEFDDFSLRISFFLESLQQEQMASSPLVI
jgi:hypothetical protein